MIIALCDGFRSMTLREMCKKVQVNVCGGSVWLAVPEGTVQLTLDFKISEEFIDMFDWADNNRPMPCMVYLSDVDLNHCVSLIDATADVGRAANSWGKKDRFLYVSNENKKDENYDFICCARLDVEIMSFLHKMNNTAPLQSSLPGVKKMPYGWLILPKPGAPALAPPLAPAPESVVMSGQRKPSVRRKRPRCAPVPFGERLAKQVLRTRSDKFRFDRKKGLLHLWLLSQVAWWLPRLKAQRPRSRPSC